ncbi:MAG TPA: glycosyltransferase family 1 protein, partial [Planctomycetes bacterium]|nr:glycosyltransferase family 1 protein [Planctomycetota bacterium]
MQRFAYVCADPGVPVPGNKGSSIHVASVCRAFKESGLQGEVHALRAEAEEIEGFPIFQIPVPIRKKRKSLQERESRLFLTSLKPLASGRIPPDFIYERYALWHSGGLAHARDLRIPFILEVNSPLPDEAKQFRGLGNEALADGIAKLLMQQADGIVCVSDEIANWVEPLRGHSEGIWVIPNGVDERLFPPRNGIRPASLPEKEVPLIAFCGSFRPWHGLTDLIEAFRIFAEDDTTGAELLCIGDGPRRSEFEARIEELGLSDRVHLTGMVPQAEVGRLLGGCDIAVAPYPQLDHFYFSPLKIFEFFAVGLPVIGSDVGQVRQLLDGENRGLLYSPGDASGLADAMRGVLADPERGKAIGNAAREWVLSK